MAVDWLEKSNGSNKIRKHDVTISYGYGVKRDSVRISFLNGCGDKITQEPFIRLGIDENKLVFTRGYEGKRDSFKLRKQKYPSNASFIVKDTRLNIFIGIYDELKYDKSTGLWYVDLNEKKEE